MCVDLINTVQENSGFPLKKIDPNTQKPAFDKGEEAVNKFSRAAIPAVLAGLYRFVQSDEGAAFILTGNDNTNWVSKIFDNNSKVAVQKISAYANRSDEYSVAKENLAGDAGIKEVKLFFSDQRSNILLYLPAELKMGGLLHDNTLDDNTNKMEGPISSLMQTIGAAFSKPVTGEEIKGE
jgi:hypothetical protein